MSGTHVEIGENSPRYSRGAFGFISNMSILLGPPFRNTMMRDLPESPDPKAEALAGKNKEAAALLKKVLLLDITHPYYSGD